MNSAVQTNWNRSAMFMTSIENRSCSHRLDRVNPHTGLPPSDDGLTLEKKTECEQIQQIPLVSCKFGITSRDMQTDWNTLWFSRQTSSLSWANEFPWSTYCLS
jgi:hypothetical protein